MLKFMIHCWWAMVCIVVASGCSTTSNDVERELKSARTLPIGYFVNEQRETLTIDKPQEVQEILGAIHVIKTRKGSQVGLKPTGTIDFILGDGTSIRTMLVNHEQLDRSHWGQIVLDSTFYEKLCEVVSRVEDKPIDLLKEN